MSAPTDVPLSADEPHPQRLRRLHSGSGPASLRRRLAMLVTSAVLAGGVLVAVGVSAFLSVLDARRDLVDNLDPARLAASGYFTALVNQQTGVRGFALSGDEEFLGAYRMGRQDEADALAETTANLGQFQRLRQNLTRLREVAGTWQGNFAEPEIAAVRRGERVPEELLAASKARFDDVRAAYEGLRADFEQERRASRAALDDDTVRLVGALGASLVALVVMGVAIWAAFRRWVVAPLDSLGGDARRVADGELAHEVAAVGPAEFRALAGDVEAMRVRIAAEVDNLRHQADELARSNADLEQFAYVASHDLQEPLRKVASFCQLLQKRYHGQLDDRADQYIDFAVDGAKRMQALINDLLTFSRVGRLIAEMDEVDCEVALGRAMANLEAAREESAATVVADALPTVRGDLSLLSALFQNLLDNAIKYRGDAPPEIRISAERAGDCWEFAVIDNGIGIDAAYVERVFVIFQRLHPKEEYSGTGIGLALCKKIVEFHGGRIWVEPEARPGTTVRWTLPVHEVPDGSIEGEENHVPRLGGEGHQDPVS